MCQVLWCELSSLQGFHIPVPVYELKNKNWLKKQSTNTRSMSRQRPTDNNGRMYAQRTLSPPAFSNTSLKPRHSSVETMSKPPRYLFYVKKYVELDQYIINFKQRKYVELARLPPAEKLELFGSTIMPIHVPLARGETMKQYEERFIHWLKRRHRITLAELEADKDSEKERHYRIKFANLNATKEEAFIPPTAKRERPSSSHRDDDADPPSKRTSTTRGENRQRFSREENTTPPFPNRCAYRPPPSRSSVSVQADSYIACGCEGCLVNGVRLLGEKLFALESEVCRGCNAKKTVTPRRLVVDLTQDDDDSHSPSRKRPRLLTSSSYQPDPIEQKLLKEYEELNETVVMNQRVLEASAAELASTPITDIQVTTRLQDENQELQELIQGEVDNRNASLAMLIVYMWRHEANELDRMVQDKTASHVPHVHRSSHHKCASLSTEMKEKRLYIARIKNQMDGIVPSSESQRLETMKKLGEMLVKAEEELKELDTSRRREFTTLIYFDAHVRSLVQFLSAHAERM